MHKIDKELAKLSEHERAQVLAVLVQIESGDFSNLDRLKLKGSTNIFRVRKGTIRIIFSVSKSGIKVLSIGRRNEKTYRGF